MPPQSCRQKVTLGADACQQAADLTMFHPEGSALSLWLQGTTGSKGAVEVAPPAA